MFRFPAITALVGILGAGSAWAQTDPAALPARDSHEGLLLAAAPLQDAAQYKAHFGKKNPYDAGIVAIEVFFRNDNDKPIRLDLESIRLLLRPPGGERQKLAPLAVENAADLIVNKGGPNPTTSRVPIPIPGRNKKGRGKDWAEAESALRGLAFDMDILPPKSSVHGFLYFNLNHRYELLEYSQLYVPGLKFMHNQQPLLFFEVDLGLAVAAPR